MFRRPLTLGSHPVLPLPQSPYQRNPKQPADIRLLRVMFGRHNSYGHLVGSLSCGIFTGIADLWAHEGMEVVCEALESIWPDPMCRPDLLFYDLGCRMRPYRLLHPAPGWLHTRYIVDRCEGVATCRPTRTMFWVVGCSGNTRIRRQIV